MATPTPVNAAGAVGDDEEMAQTATTIDDELTDPVVGLEVTVAGNVLEVVDDNAFRIDKDGVGEPTGATEEEIIGDVDDYNDEYRARPVPRRSGNSTTAGVRSSGVQPSALPRSQKILHREPPRSPRRSASRRC